MIREADVDNEGMVGWEVGASVHLCPWVHSVLQKAQVVYSPTIFGLTHFLGYPSCWRGYRLGPKYFLMLGSFELYQMCSFAGLFKNDDVQVRTGDWDFPLRKCGLASPQSPTLWWTCIISAVRAPTCRVVHLCALTVSLLDQCCCGSFLCASLLQWESFFLRGLREHCERRVIVKTLKNKGSNDAGVHASLSK